MGFPFTSGYYSKDAIIETAYLSNSNFADYAYILLTIGVVMTSFYSWRLMFLVFNGKTRMAEEDYRKVHESSSIMLIPLMILAIGALFFGFIFKSYFIGYNSDEFWNGSIVLYHEDHHNIPLLIYYLPAILGVVGFFIAWMMYLRKSNIAKNIAELNKPLHNFLLNKWYFDELYNMVLVKPAIGIGKLFWKLIDGYIIDGFGPNGLASLVSRISSRTKQIQSGFIYHYAFIVSRPPMAFYIFHLIVGSAGEGIQAYRGIYHCLFFYPYIYCYLPSSTSLFKSPVCSTQPILGLGKHRLVRNGSEAACQIIGNMKQDAKYQEETTNPTLFPDGRNGFDQERLKKLSANT